MKQIVLFFLLTITFLPLSGQEVKNCFLFASKQERNFLLKKLNDTIINPSAKAYLLHDTPIRWSSYAWATAYLQDTSHQNYLVLEKALKNISQLNSLERQFVVQTAYSCFPSAYVIQMKTLAAIEKENPKTFASAIAYLAMNKIDVMSLLDNFGNTDNPIIWDEDGCLVRSDQQICGKSHPKKMAMPMYWK